MTDQTRRTFLKQAAIGTAAVLAYPSATVLGANDRVRIGMIGVGDRGNDLLGQVLKVPNVDLVAMADVYRRRRDQAKSRVPGIQTFDDHRRLLDMKDIDGVIVASPLHIHARHFVDTLAAGKDLYAEKTHPPKFTILAFKRRCTAFSAVLRSCVVVGDVTQISREFWLNGQANMHV